MKEKSEDKTVVVPVRRVSPGPLDNERWNAWAAGIARTEAKRCIEILVDVLKPKLVAQKARIKALEHEVELLKQRLEPIEQEWPLRTLTNALEEELSRR